MISHDQPREYKRVGWLWPLPKLYPQAFARWSDCHIHQHPDRTYNLMGLQRAVPRKAPRYLAAAPLTAELGGNETIWNNRVERCKFKRRNCNSSCFWLPLVWSQAGLPCTVGRRGRSDSNSAHSCSVRVPTSSLESPVEINSPSSGLQHPFPLLNELLWSIMPPTFSDNVWPLCFRTVALNCQLTVHPFHMESVFQLHEICHTSLREPQRADVHVPLRADGRALRRVDEMNLRSRLVRGLPPVTTCMWSVPLPGFGRVEWVDASENPLSGMDYATITTNHTHQIFPSFSGFHQPLIKLPWGSNLKFRVPSSAPGTLGSTHPLRRREKAFQAVDGNSDPPSGLGGWEDLGRVVQFWWDLGGWYGLRCS